MSVLEDLFGTEKPIIGLVHLKPLPGDPFWPADGSISDVIDAAAADLVALQSGGIDGVLFTNEFSVPYQKHVSPVTVASMSCVIGALLDEILVPFGAEAIYDGDASMDVCAATGASFTRCVFTGVWSGDLGLVDRDVATTLRHRHDLRLDDLLLLYFVTSEGEANVGGRSAFDQMDSLGFNCRPDAYVLGGSSAGAATEPATFAEARRHAGDVPVICGTGCRADSIAGILADADGAFVGTSLKQGGIIENPVDETRVHALMDAARAAREGR
ncbi:MAG: BtpA/SgcQ family protein [Atopobiaceae bacterium]|jgi:membrane complex biogenesis BtpA family protein|nr:BtpA/SgcQ family protein [Atopobiaceae bacterium]MCI2172631.1 BtpA/SgcQ family protein [Atopobiaceae bacterium]MCI2206938.1 BtpA/SgcQ family protein [Atopobiaceae bacterium]